MSLAETSENRKLVGHKKYVCKIPKLNLEILPNYHGHHTKSVH